MKLREQNLTLQFVSIFFLNMRNLEFRVYSIHFCRRRSRSQGFNSIQGLSAFQFIFFSSRKLIVEFLVNYPIPQLIICHSQGQNHFPLPVTKPKHAELEKEKEHTMHTYLYHPWRSEHYVFPPKHLRKTKQKEAMYTFLLMAS